MTVRNCEYVIVVRETTVDASFIFTITLAIVYQSLGYRL